MNAEPNYWADETFPRINFYKFEYVGEKISETELWNSVWDTLGELGYRFHYEDRAEENVLVSLDKPISEEHLKNLESKFKIEKLKTSS